MLKHMITNTELPPILQPKEIMFDDREKLLDCNKTQNYIRRSSGKISNKGKIACWQQLKLLTFEV